MFRIVGLILQRIINLVGVALQFVIGIFPDSPFRMIEKAGFGDLLAKINFFIPVYEFVSIAQAWLIAIGVYYLWSVYARWVKAID